MSKLSRAVPVNLYHDYKSIPFSVADACQSCYPIYNADEERCVNPAYSLIQAIYVLDQTNGSTLEDIISTATQICPSFSDAAFRATFQNALRKGIFTSIVPVQIDYFLGTNGPTRYIIGPEMDRYAQGAPYVKFLLSLVGGYKSPLFLKWFSLAKLSCISSAASCRQCA
jgi:hypothetical protein